MAALTFLAVTAVLIIEPFRLIVTVPMGIYAARQSRQMRWALIAGAGVVSSIAIGALSLALTDRPNFSFPWAQSVIAGSIQALIVMLLTRVLTRKASAA